MLTHALNVFRVPQNFKVDVVMKGIQTEPTKQLPTPG
jgi:hypothetical protein